MLGSTPVKPPIEYANNADPVWPCRLFVDRQYLVPHHTTNVKFDQLKALTLDLYLIILHAGSCH